MPLLESGRNRSCSAGTTSSPARRQSQLSNMAKSAILSSASTSPGSDDLPTLDRHDSFQKLSTMMGPPKTIPNRNIGNQPQRENKPTPSQQFLNPTNGIGHALNDTPLSTAPSSPQMYGSGGFEPVAICANILQSS